MIPGIHFFAERIRSLTLALQSRDQGYARSDSLLLSPFDDNAVGIGNIQDPTRRDALLARDL